MIVHAFSKDTQKIKRGSGTAAAGPGEEKQRRKQNEHVKKQNEKLKSKLKKQNCFDF